jgi:glucose dehydrogenase
MVDRSFADRVKETTTTTGTGNITLAGAVAQFISFNTAFGVGPSFDYAIVGQSGTEWEVGEGVLSGSTTLVRTTVRASSNSNAAVSFSAGTKDVFCTIGATSINKLQTLAQVRAVVSLRV